MIDGGGKSWLFKVSGSLHIEGLRLARGFVRSPDTGGGAIFSRKYLTIQNSMLHDNTADEAGATLYLETGSTTTYVLPAPPGFWAPATTCEIWREACPDSDVKCKDAAESCSKNATDNVNTCTGDSGSACKLATESQPCSWRSTPELLGETVYVIPLGSHDDDLPTPCAPGVLGGNGSIVAEQTSSTCAGWCPAGTYQPEYAATLCVECPLLSYCEAGAAGPSSCPDGTYGNATSLRSADECAPCPVGGYCKSGGYFKCPTGSFNPSPDASDATVCLSCNRHFGVEHLVTSAPGASQPEQCVCASGYYDTVANTEERNCQACDGDLLCTSSGLTLATVPLLSSRWRHSSRTSSIYVCATASSSSACLGGADSAAYCADGHTGPRCEWCVDSAQYYDAASASCKLCDGEAGYALVQSLIAVSVLAAFGILRVVVLRSPKLLAGISSRLAQLMVAAQQFGLQAKYVALHSNLPPWATSNMCALLAPAGSRAYWPSTRCGRCARASMASRYPANSAARLRGSRH